MKKRANTLAAVKALVEPVGRLDEFREEQRRRRLMSTEALAAALAAERACRSDLLFGKRLGVPAVSSETAVREVGSRFPDEIAALRAYAVAAVALAGRPGALRNTGRIEGVRPAGRGRSLNGTASAAVGSRSRRIASEPASLRRLSDFVDVGTRLRQMPLEQVELLLDRYVFGVPARVLADRRGHDRASIGSKISSARRALRKNMSTLLPQAEKVVLAANDGPRDRRTKRRSRIIRFMKSRMSEPLLHEMNES